jgi:spore germination protein
MKNKNMVILTGMMVIIAFVYQALEVKWINSKMLASQEVYASEKASKRRPSKPTPMPTSTPTSTPTPKPTVMPTPIPIPTPTLVVPQLKPPVGLNKQIVGFYTEDWVGDTASLQSVNTYGAKMSGIATFSYQLQTDGTFAGSAPATAISNVRNSGGKVVALFHNYIGGVFNKDIIHNALVDQALRSRVQNNILAVVKNNGFDGVNIDFENIPSADRAVFTTFMSELTKLLHNNGFMVTISIPAKTWDNPNDGWSGAFDYKALGVLADRLMLMTYDEHWYGGPSGPVASIGWVEQVIKYTVSQVSADKLLLGVGMYGYDWEVASGITTRALSAKKALQVASQYGSVINWDSTAQAPYFYYTTNGVQHIVWFESNNSATFKMNLVKTYNLAGVAIWRLGYEDSGFWQTIISKFTTQ